jgi:hypothetical protein
MKTFTPEDRLLFACARQHLQPAHRQIVADICRSETIKWDVLCSTAETHSVAPLIYANLRQCGADVPAAVAARFRFCTACNLAAKEDKAKKLAELVSFFDSKSIDVMLVKGVALDVLVYEQTWYITSNDADIVMRMRVEDQTNQEEREILSRMCRRGWIPLDETKPAARALREIWSQICRHSDWLECNYFEHHDVTMTDVLPVDFQRIWTDAVRVEFRGQSVFVMSPEDLLIATCINSCRKRFFRLKAVCDIAEIVRKYSDLRWDALVQKARDYDCSLIVYAALFVAQTTVGCELPEGLLTELKVHPVRAAVIRYLSERTALNSLSSLYSGKNLFGKKIGSSLLLPYATCRWYQMGRKARAALGYVRERARRARRPSTSGELSN